MNMPKVDIDDYNHILKVLDKRSSNVRRNVFILIYFLVIVVATVIVIAYNIKNTSNSPLANAISAAIGSTKQNEINEVLANFAMNLKVARERQEGQAKTQGDLAEANSKKSDDAVSEINRGDWFAMHTPSKSTSEKIAESIAALVISFSIFMFIGFVMRAILVFIRYYMQLGTDFENQKIAFMLSKGEPEMFSKSLSILREHNISFEKTPSMPQEKLISKILDLVKNTKNDSLKP